MKCLQICEKTSETNTELSNKSEHYSQVSDKDITKANTKNSAVR